MAPPQSMPTIAASASLITLLSGLSLSSEFAAALSQQSSSAAALSSAAAALLVGNRGSDDANSDLIVPTHDTIKAFGMWKSDAWTTYVRVRPDTAAAHMDAVYK